jgi:hypothetical protein
MKWYIKLLLDVHGFCIDILFLLDKFLFTISWLLYRMAYIVKIYGIWLSFYLVWLITVFAWTRSTISILSKSKRLFILATRWFINTDIFLKVLVFVILLYGLCVWLWVRLNIFDVISNILITFTDLL